MPNSDLFRSLGLPKEMASELAADARTTEAEALAAMPTSTFVRQFLTAGTIDLESTFVESVIDVSDPNTITLPDGTTDGQEMIIQVNGRATDGGVTTLAGLFLYGDGSTVTSIEFNDATERFLKVRWSDDDAKWLILERSINLSGAETTVGGDLSGTLPAPEVAAIHETAGPTRLAIGSITDGQFLKRVGSEVVGAAAPSAGTFPSPGYQGLGDADGTVDLAVRVSVFQPNDQTITVPTPSDMTAAHGLVHVLRSSVRADPDVVVTIIFTAGLFNGQGTTSGQIQFLEADYHDFIEFVWDHSLDKWLLLTANFTQFA